MVKISISKFLETFIPFLFTENLDNRCSDRLIQWKNQKLEIKSFFHKKAGYFEKGRARA